MMLADGSHVAFVSVDPDMYQLHELKIISPVNMSVEQLFTDPDIGGQLQALKRLSLCTPQGLTIKSTRSNSNDLIIFTRRPGD